MPTIGAVGYFCVFSVSFYQADFCSLNQTFGPPVQEYPPSQGTRPVLFTRELTYQKDLDSHGYMLPSQNGAEGVGVHL